MIPTLTLLRPLGFLDADSTMVSDKPVLGLIYLTRQHQGQHQYVSLCHYEGRFLEAVLYVYGVAFNVKAARGKRVDAEKRGGAPIYANIARSWEDLAPLLDSVYKAPV